VVERGNDSSQHIGNRAVDRAQTFFRDNDLLFERIDRRDGINAVLTLANSGPDAGLSVNLKINGGKEYKRKRHVDERYKRRGQASFREADPKLWKEITPPRGFEGHHVIDMNLHLRNVWRNNRPIYVITQDPDDEELYFGNLARMADVEALKQDLASSYERMGSPEEDSLFHKYLAKVHREVSHLSEDNLRLYRTWIPLYPDLRLTPDGLERFLIQARAEARQPIPDPSDGVGEVPIYVTYPDGTIGLSREALIALDIRYAVQELHDSSLDELSRLQNAIQKTQSTGEAIDPDKLAAKVEATTRMATFSRLLRSGSKWSLAAIIASLISVPINYGVNDFMGWTPPSVTVVRQMSPSQMDELRDQILHQLEQMDQRQNMDSQHALPRPNRSRY
jgi:hypothetical protein